MRIGVGASAAFGPTGGAVGATTEAVEGEVAATEAGSGVDVAFGAIICAWTDVIAGEHAKKAQAANGEKNCVPRTVFNEISFYLRKNAVADVALQR